MVRRLFGTDGIRGAANREPITARTALSVAMAAGAELGRSHPHKLVVIGKDTRLSGYMLEPALTAGFASVGMDVVLLGPVPTPAVGMLTRSLRADLGVVISASHNPYDDNGIKLFGPDGFKLSDEVEKAIEARLEGDLDGALVPSDATGRVRRMEDSVGRYIEFVKSAFPRHLRLDGLKVVVDCANGAAWRVGAPVLHELGAEVIALGVEPNGYNINLRCGATAPEGICGAVVKHEADLGIALDGDADRVILADEKGRVVDGDQVMAVIARFWQQTGRLRGGGVVATVMSNLGLERYLEGLGLELVRTPVGDRYVVDAMRAGGYNVGGEQSGHVVLTDYATTGDGLIAALQVLAMLVETGQRPSALLRSFEPYPQLLRNVRFNGGQPLKSERVIAAIKYNQGLLGDSGRLLIRKSGTEPLIRIMAEGQDPVLVARVVEDLAAHIASAAAE